MAMGKKKKSRKKGVGILGAIVAGVTIIVGVGARKAGGVVEPDNGTNGTNGPPPLPPEGCGEMPPIPEGTGIYWLNPFNDNSGWAGDISVVPPSTTILNRGGFSQAVVDWFRCRRRSCLL